MGHFFTDGLQFFNPLRLQDVGHPHLGPRTELHPRADVQLQAFTHA
jgi:hypothetical protein